jgi:hypothetical protein
MRIDPFTYEEYQGRILQYDCDSCGKITDYEEDAYGQDFLVLCTECSPPPDPEFISEEPDWQPDPPDPDAPVHKDICAAYWERGLECGCMSAETKRALRAGARPEDVL